MEILVVGFGDPTTTGGKVIAVRANIHDSGKAIALHGERATCGNCKGSWSMVGTGEGMSDEGVQVVVQGDHVLCPCGKNHVIAGPDVGCFVEKDIRTSNSATIPTASHKHAHAPPYDEQFTLLDEHRRPLANVRYRIVTDSGKVYTGATNSAGQTQRVTTNETSRLQLQLEKQ